MITFAVGNRYTFNVVLQRPLDVILQPVGPNVFVGHSGGAAENTITPPFAKWLFSHIIAS